MRGVERGISVAPVLGMAATIGSSIGRPSFGLEGGIRARAISNPFKGAENKAHSFSSKENRRPSFLESNIGVIRNPLSSKGSSVVEAKIPPQTVSVAMGGLPSGPEAVNIAEQWLKISKSPIFVPKPAEISVVNPLRVRPIPRPMDFVWKQPTVLPLPNPEPTVKVKNEPKIHPNTEQMLISKTLLQRAGLTEMNKKVVQENVVGQNLTEEVLIKEKIDEKPEISEREEIEEWKLKDLLDEETAQQRIYEISEAIDLAETDAKEEGVDEIDGPRILKFIRLHIGLISRIAKKLRKDGSLDETLEELAARKFSSKNQAKEQTKELVAQKEPVRRGKEGKAVKEGARERVLKYQQLKGYLKDQVLRRVVKKQTIQTGNGVEPVQTQPVVVEIKEPKIEDNADLAELFLRKVA